MKYFYFPSPINGKENIVFVSNFINEFPQFLNALMFSKYKKQDFSYWSACLRQQNLKEIYGRAKCGILNQTLPLCIVIILELFWLRSDLVSEYMFTAIIQILCREISRWRNS